MVEVSPITHLKLLLRQHGVKQAELARLLKRDKAVVTNLFQGRRQLKAAEAVIIARHIGVPVAQVMGIEEPIETVQRDQVHRLFNEIDCRIAHGASSNGHLDYVHKELRAILDAPTAEKEQGK